MRLLTAPSAGAVAVLEFRGASALTELARLCPQVSSAPVGALRRVRLELDGEWLDDALVRVASCELVELHLHGSRALVQRLFEYVHVADPSATHARSLEGDAEELLTAADNEPAARILLDQAQGALRRELEAIVRLADRAASERLAQLHAAGAHAALCLRPPQVALVGPVNAGKSTLFNLLVGEQRAIVSSSPGATRDVLSAPARLGEWPIVLLDTAGERELQDGSARAQLEQAGQALARRATAAADWVLRLWPADRGAPPERTSASARREAWIESRADLAPTPLPRCDARVSAAADPEHALDQIARLYRAAFALPLAPWSAGRAAPFDARSREAVRLARDGVGGADPQWRQPLRELLGN